ncbi:MAG: GNAT family N-acetyltransferase [Saprospiraceae bacterium]|nr:GNAT family N-acetyltransferase [Saprospiraceae bacterium]
MKEIIRPIRLEDVEQLKAVLDTIDLFPSVYLDEMISDYFNNSETEDIWFTVVNNEIPIAIAYCTPEKFTEGTYNLLAIGVKKDNQNKGIGGKMMDYLEDVLRQAGHRILIVETSSNLELTKAFYHKCNYTQEAIIRDFWAKGDDKVIFWKRLTD